MQKRECLRLCMMVAAAGIAAATARVEAVCLNEFMASNGTCLADGEGQYEDWIELHNPGSLALDVGGMFLTDDSAEPTRWQIPGDRPDQTIIPAGGFILIWADNDANDTGLHASFKLSSDGEELVLIDRDGLAVLDRIAFGHQSGDVSYGRYPDAGPEWGLMTVPTPGAPNARPFEAVVEEVTFSVEHGFYDDPFAVALATATPDARIWYTLDGREPQGATLYTRPLQVDRTTCIRAVATSPGCRDSGATSCTYIFIDDIPGQLAPAPQPPGPPPPPTRRSVPAADGSTSRLQIQASTPADPALRAALHAIPSVCIVMEPNDFFDPVTGINANPLGRGVEWERPASIEWLDPAGKLSFQVNAGLRIHGGVSRSNREDKHSLRMLFKSQYGPPVLEAPLFEDCDITRFESLVLRNTMHDSWTGAMGGRPQYLRDQFSRDTMRDMGRLTPYGRPVHVFINGLYWGLFVLVERPDDGFAAEHLGGDKDQYDALKAHSVSDPDNSTVEVVAGDIQAWHDLFALAQAGLEGQNAYALIQQYLDVPSFIDYMLMVFYIGSTDGPAGIGGPPRNFWAVRPREADGGFVFLAWDLEFSLNNLSENRVTVKGTEDPHLLFQQLAANPEFRMLLADHIHRHLFHGALTPESATDRYLARSGDVEKAIWAEAFRWGSSQSPTAVNSLCNSWASERDRIVLNYFPLRSGVVVDQLRQAGLYPAVEPPVLEIDGIEHRGGSVPPGATLALSNPNAAGVTYYTADGSDSRTPYHSVDANELTLIIPAEAAKRVFVPTGDIGDDWTGGSEPYDDTDWTAGTPVVPATGGAVGYVGGRARDNRISYNIGRAMDGRTSCYIRIPFRLAAAELPHLSRLALRIQCDDGFVAYLNGVEVASLNKPAGLAWNSSCADRLESAEPTWTPIPRNLDVLRPGDNILAIHALDSSADTFFLLSAELFGGENVTFGEDVAPSAMEYVGPLALIRSTQVKARVWHSGVWSALTEAVFAVGPVCENLRITEIMYHPPEPNEEFIELANIGTETINLNLVRFVGGIDFAFPNVELAPQAVTLVVRDYQAFTARYGPDFAIAGQYQGALDNAGERLRLQDAVGRTILDFRYDDEWYPETDGGEYSLECRACFHQDPNAFSYQECWGPSLHEGGSPGVLPPISYEH